MTEVAPNPLENTRFSDFAILLFYDHPAKGRIFEKNFLFEREINVIALIKNRLGIVKL